MPIIPLNNPQNIDKYFYNRKKDIKQINYYLNSLNDDISQQLLITGFRGVGKTLLLKKIISMQPDNFITAYLDLSQTYSLNNGILTEEKVLKDLFNKMNTAAMDKLKNSEKLQQHFKSFISSLTTKDYSLDNSAEIFNMPIPHGSENYEKLSKFIMEFPQNTVDLSDNINGFIIIIDEFQLLKSLGNSEAFFWLIRSFTQKQDNVTYIFTGSITESAEIIKMINGNTGAFGGRVIHINIDPFTKEETKSYVNDKLHLKFTDDGFNQFYSCTRGIPSYINSFSNMLSENTEYDKDMIIEEFTGKMNQILIMWMEIWGRLNDNEKEIIILLVENNKLTWTNLNNKVSFSNATLNKYLNNLSNKGFVKYENKYYLIEDKMLKTWLKHQKKINGIYPY